MTESESGASEFGPDPIEVWAQRVLGELDASLLQNAKRSLFARQKPIKLMDNYAKGVLEDILEDPDPSEAGGMLSAKASKSGFFDDISKPSKRRTSLSKQMYLAPGEDDEDAGGWRGRRRTSAMLGSREHESISLTDLVRASSKASQHPDEDIANVLTQVREVQLAEGLNEEMLSKAYNRFPWLRSTPEPSKKTEIPDLSKYLDVGIISILHNLFNESELECLYEMFIEYAYVYESKGEDVTEVIHRYDCEAALYWVGIAPATHICDYADAQVEQARVNKQQAKLFSEDGGPLFTVDMFMRWMAIYRIKHKEWWVMKGCLPDQIAQFVREQFGQYDTKGDGLKTRQVFELLGALSCRPETVEDQQRVIGYIKLADVDGSGTIDFLEFLQLLRLVMEYDTKRMRSREMDLIHSTGMTPDQIDGLREAFEQFDTKKSLSLNLGAIKRLFDKGAGSGKGFTFDRQRMVILTDSLREAENRVSKIRMNMKKQGCGQSLVTDFGEFCVLVHVLVAHKADALSGADGDITKAFDGLVNRSGLEAWVAKRSAPYDEIRGRWELMMLERHVNVFYQHMISDFKVTPRDDSTPRPVFFNADKAPRRMTTAHRTVEVTWKLLEDRADPPGAMSDMKRSSKTKTPSKQSKSKESPSRGGSKDKAEKGRVSPAGGRTPSKDTSSGPKGSRAPADVKGTHRRKS